MLGAYRDVEVDRQHPLADALGTLPRETRYEHVGLAGLDRTAVQALLDSIAQAGVAPALAEALARETSGNPFFIREVLLHLLEEGALARDGRRWSTAPNVAAKRIPETVRQVIARRLGRLSAAATGLLRVAAAFTAGVPFEVARRVAGLGEAAALDALDEALGAQLLAATGDPQVYDFPHALVRHTLYDALSPARQVRLHREVAEAMEAVYGQRATEHAAEIAEHYHRSATLPGAERGVPYCVAAADQAERSSAFADVVTHLSAALDLLPAMAPERPRLLGRLGFALPFAGRFDDSAEAVAREAAMQIAETEGRDAAAKYLAEALAEPRAVGAAAQHLGHLARQGLDYLGDRRDATWAVLKAHEIRAQELDDPSGLGIALDTPDRRELAAVLRDLSSTGRLTTIDVVFFQWVSGVDISLLSPSLMMVPRRDLPGMREGAEELERQGKIGGAVRLWAMVSRCHIILGEFTQAQDARRRAGTLAERLPEAQIATSFLAVAEHEWRMAMDEGWDAPMESVGPGIVQGAYLVWFRIYTLASVARIYARMGHVEPAVQALAGLLPAIERWPEWATNYARVVCEAAETLWLTERTDHSEVIERNLREKVIEPGYHSPFAESRLALARLCALQGRHDEARGWFAQARTVLDEQGARPLRAIVDYDEALMYARRGATGDLDRAWPLVDVALVQFRSLDMSGWIRRAETLRSSCEGAGVAAQAARTPSVAGNDDSRMLLQRDEPATASDGGGLPRTGDGAPVGGNVFRKEGDYWTIAYEDGVFRLKDSKGLHYMAHLLRHPGTEFHANDLVAAAAGPRAGAPSNAERGPSRQELAAEGLVVSRLGGVPALLDARAKAAYQERLSDLREELADAERLHDLGRAEHAGAEIDFLTTELTAPFRGHQKANPYAERARLTVTKGIKAALERISQNHPALGRHLAVTIRRGTFCAYTPDPRHPIPWTF